MSDRDQVRAAIRRAVDRRDGAGANPLPRRELYHRARRIACITDALMQGEQVTAIARREGLTRDYVSLIRRGHYWRDLTSELGLPGASPGVRKVEYRVAHNGHSSRRRPIRLRVVMRDLYREEARLFASEARKIGLLARPLFVGPSGSYHAPMRYWILAVGGRRQRAAPAEFGDPD